MANKFLGTFIVGLLITGQTASATDYAYQTPKYYSNPPQGAPAPQIGSTSSQPSGPDPTQILLMNSMRSSEHEHRFEVNHQYYDLSIGGMREYVDGLKSDNPQLYKKLDPSLSKLESRRTTAWVVGGGLFLIGATAAIASFTFMQSEGTLDGRPTFDTNIPLLIGGSVVATGGLITALVVSPTEKDLIRLINSHNKEDSKNPIKIDLGIQVLNKSPGLAVSLSF